jgi:outer membrane receptor protein involved in Fe transport
MQRSHGAAGWSALSSMRWFALFDLNGGRVPSPRTPCGRLAAVILSVIGLASPATAQKPAPTSAAPHQSLEGGAMDSVNVHGEPYQPMRSDVQGAKVWLGIATRFPGFSQPSLMGPTVVTATRTPQTPDRIAATVHVLDEAALRQTPSFTLDGALRSVPAFSLFRRSDSFTANPTAQGVSLRGLGPSGASRSLVLLDGVPLNDPFGGWVAWTKLPREAVARAEFVPGGGATAWGNAALGGALQIFTLPVRAEIVVVDEPPAPMGMGYRGTARFAFRLGDFGTHSEEIVLTRPFRHGVLQLLAREFSTNGFSLVAPEKRGPIDVPAWSRHRWFTARWRQPIGKTAELTATARGFEEFRGNGTPFQRNGSREKFASVAVSAQPNDNFAWNSVAYAQAQSFASTFSSVNATRTAETPASDQYAVPSTAFGAAWTGAWKSLAGGRTSLGVDARWVEGETRENFSFAAGAFTRQRVAGGEQSVAGLFALHERRIAAPIRFTVGARLDYWQESDGHRRETDRITGATLRNDHYTDRDGFEFSPSLGLVWTPHNQWRVRASAQHAFRRPTLNELYRPFRQGSNVTETNPELKTERVTSGEMGAEWTIGKPFGMVARIEPEKPQARRTTPRPTPVTTGVALSATAFWNELDDAVGNVTVARGPGTFPLFGTLPVGGVGRQRLNLDRTRVRGFEAAATWRPHSTFSLHVAALYNDATVQTASVAPALAGKRIAQVPRRSFTVGGAWLAPGDVTLTPRVRWIGRQFEDDENTLRLGEAVVADLGASRPLTKHLQLFISVENLGNARLETGRSADGVVNVGTPRLFLGGLRGSW